MHTNFLRILHLGEHNFWKILHDISTATQDDYLAWKKHLDNTSIYLWKGPKNGPEAASFLSLLESLDLPMTTYNCASLDAQGLQEKAAKRKAPALHITCGFSEASLDVLCANGEGTWFTGLSTVNSPWAALAEIALFKSLSSEIDKFRVCIIGAVNGLSQSLMEASIYAPFELFMGIPPWGDPDHHQTGMALKSGAKIFMTREPNLALDGAHLIYIDTRLVQMADEHHGKGPVTIPLGMDNFAWKEGFKLSAEFKKYATDNAPVLTLIDSSDNTILPELDVELSKKRAELRKYTLMATLSHAAQSNSES